MVEKFICNNAPVTKSTHESELSDWYAAGTPPGLALKVYRSWKEGKLYQATKEEAEAKRAILQARGFEGLARHVFVSWTKGEIFRIP